MYNYSVIIPHKNTPDLLQRCLDTIPIREDLEVIVVDDNSDGSLVNFSQFPGVNRVNTMVVFSKGEQGKGPGYARNLGMTKAQGKWIIFSDSDDYFGSSFNDLLEKYKHSSKELIFFKCLRQNLDGEVNEYPLINKPIEDALRVGETDGIVYGVPCPWGKFIQRDFLNQYKIRYQEITGGDDIMFSIQMAVHLQDFQIVEDVLYCVVDRPGSLTRNTHWRSFYSYSKACCDVYSLMLSVGREKRAMAWLSSWWGFLWAENKLAAVSLFPYIFRKLRFMDAARAIKKGCKVGPWNWQNS